MAAVFLDKVGKSILAIFLILIVFFVTRILTVMKKDSEE
jgi:hypothetical protein